MPDNDGMVNKVRFVDPHAAWDVAPRILRGNNPQILNDEIQPIEDIRNTVRKRTNNVTIGDFLAVHTKGTFGVEVEIEGANLLNRIAGVWVDKADGSLRNGREYVLKKPLLLSDCKKAIIGLNKALAEFGSLLEFSFRTSVHVHVNILDMNKHQLLAFIYLTHLFENALVRYSGESRIGNRFCLRTQDACEKLNQISNFFESRGINHIPIEKAKYAAINLAPITTQGSVEFRSMRGTLDVETLSVWLDVLQHMRDIALITPISQIATDVKHDPLYVASGVLAPHFDKFNYPELESDIKSAYRLLIELPHYKVKE